MHEKQANLQKIILEWKPERPVSGEKDGRRVGGVSEKWCDIGIMEYGGDEEARQEEGRE